MKQLFHTNHEFHTQPYIVKSVQFPLNIYCSYVINRVSTFGGKARGKGDFIMTKLKTKSNNNNNDQTW